MKRNNKGFTLIELLITIVMLLSLTILVVVSFVKVSDRKKEEAEKITDKQIEKAAEQFFSSEYYWIKYLKDNPSSDVYVNVAKLVEDDYLNVISKTTTEKKYNGCDIVKVTYKDGRINYEYQPAKDDAKDCNPVLKFASGIDIEITPISYKLGNKADGKQWYINQDVVLNIKISAQAKESDINKIKDVKFLYQNKDATAKLTNKTDYEWKYEFTFDKNNLNYLKVIAYNFDSKNASEKEFSLYLDKEIPSIDSKAYTYEDDLTGYKEFSDFDAKYYLASDSWVNTNSSMKNIYYSANSTDNVSGINTKKSSCTLNDKKASFSKNKVGNTYSLYNNFTKDGVYNINCSFEDLAGNKNTSSYVIKKDTSKPTCSLKIVGDVKTAKKKDGKYVLKNNTFDIKTEEKTNYTGWYSDDEIVVSFKKKSDSYKYGLSTSSKVYNSKSSDIHSEETSKTTWYGYIMDEAGNENKCSRSLKNDYTAPTLVKAEAGSVNCLKKDSKDQYNSFGYSIKFKDNLSGATVRMTKYFSHWSCTDGSFDWASSTLQSSSNGSNEKIYTGFAGCSNNPSPKAKYILIDNAGNVYNKGKEITLTAKKTSPETSGKECASSKWFNENPNIK